MKLRKHAEKQPTSAETNAKDQPTPEEKNEPISFYEKRMEYRQREKNDPTAFYVKQTKRYPEREKNEPISFCEKRMELYREREEDAESEAKTELYYQDSEKKSVFWSILDKAAAYALFAFFCISLLLSLILNIMLYREQLGVSTEFEQRFMDFIPETLRVILSKEEYRRKALLK